MKFITKAILIASVVAAAASCSTPTNIPYFQDLGEGSLDTIATAKTIRIRPGDKISIIVNSRDNMLTNLFNLPYTTKTIGLQSESYGTSYSQGISGYSVATDGTIDFPVLGSVKVEGLTREEISELIKSELISNDLVKDPVVTVEYMNLKVSVLGEVTRPGRFAIDMDSYTLLDAISAAGDLTIYGVRENVKVLRTVNGMKQTYVVNLCDAQSVLSSPVYYLQQNDIVYVEPNNVRARQSTVNGNNVRSTSFWMSIASLAVTISYYFFLFNK